MNDISLFIKAGMKQAGQNTQNIIEQRRLKMEEIHTQRGVAIQMALTKAEESLKILRQSGAGFKELESAIATEFHDKVIGVEPEPGASVHLSESPAFVIREFGLQARNRGLAIALNQTGIIIARIMDHPISSPLAPNLEKIQGASLSFITNPELLETLRSYELSDKLLNDIIEAICIRRYQIAHRKKSSRT